MIVLVVGGIGSLMLLALATRSPVTPSLTSPSAAINVETASVSSAAVAPVVAPRSVSVPRWIATGPSRRGRTGANGSLFELAANEDVAVWRKRVRPVLTVRCVGKSTEVFVMTHSAASFERNSGQHTVLLSFDDEAGVEQTWEHSVDHDALFAPDGAALAHQIAGASRMSFTFTPFNASPAVVNFSVAGLDAQLASAAKKCTLKQ